MAANNKPTKHTKTKRSKRRSWTDTEKEHAIAVYTTNGNLSKTSRETGVPISTLRGWLAEVPPAKVQEAREDAQASFVKEAWKAVIAYAQHLTSEEVIKKTAAVPSATTIGILIDKIQLVTGQPTGISRLDGQVTNRHEYDITHKVEEYADIYTKLASRRGIFTSSDAGDHLGESLDIA